MLRGHRGNGCSSTPSIDRASERRTGTAEQVVAVAMRHRCVFDFPWWLLSFGSDRRGALAAPSTANKTVEATSRSLLESS